MRKLSFCLFVICLVMTNASYGTSEIEESGYEKVVDEIITNLADNEESFEINCEGQAYRDMKVIIFDKQEQGIDREKNIKFWSLVFDELPEYTRYSMMGFSQNYQTGPTNLLMNIHVSYSHSNEEKEQVYTQARQLIDAEFKALTDSQKLVKIHNLLTNRVSYDDHIESLYAFSPLPFFDQDINSGQMVCQGYAIVVDLLCQMTGLEAEIVEGRLDGVDHLWNKVKIGEHWYHFDVTSDDQLSTEEISFRYFGLSDQKMQETHEFEERKPMCENNLELEEEK